MNSNIVNQPSLGDFCSGLVNFVNGTNTRVAVSPCVKYLDFCTNQEQNFVFDHTYWAEVYDFLSNISVLVSDFLKVRVPVQYFCHKWRPSSGGWLPVIFYAIQEKNFEVPVSFCIFICFVATSNVQIILWSSLILNLQCSIRCLKNFILQTNLFKRDSSMRLFGLGFFHEWLGLVVGLKCQYSVFQFLVNSVSYWWILFCFPRQNCRK